MNDSEIVEALRAEGTRRTPVELAELLDELTGGGLSQGAIVTYFYRAFPAIPLGDLRRAGNWNRVSAGSLTDEGFNDLLRPWLQTVRNSPPRSSLE